MSDLQSGGHPEKDQPAKRGVGAPKGNTHNLKHGRRAQRHGLVLAKLGERDKRAYLDLLAIRKYLEALLERAGKLDGISRFRVQTILRLEAMCRQVEHDLRDQPKMSALDRRTLMESVVRWTCQRDANIAALLKGVDTASASIDWDRIIEDAGLREKRTS
jgi:hypothetical protein